jgi:hypothetical protein
MKSTWKQLLAVASVFALLMGVFMFITLFAIRVKPIEYTEPPDFVSRRTSDRFVQDDPELEVTSVTPDQPLEALEQSIAPDAPRLEDLKGQKSLQPFVAYMKDENQEVRIAAVQASLFQAIFFRDPKVWDALGDDRAIVEAAFYEALVDSVENGSGKGIGQRLLHVISDFPGEGTETIELIAWASNNHSEPITRDLAMYYMVKLAPKNTKTIEIINNRAKDPSAYVRFHALGYRFERLRNSYEQSP